MEFQHYSVMLSECMDYLSPKSGGVYFDGTAGGGGHTGEILRLSQPAGKVVAVDRDDSAITAFRKRLAVYGDRLIPVKGNFKDAARVLDKLGISKLSGVLLDLGVSSWQLDNFERGFSYRSSDAPLDMRMDESQSLTAYQVINEYPLERLIKVFFEYGEEKFSRRIAANIVEDRGKAPISTCGQLVEIILKSIPAAARRTGGHPAKRVFQAVRIEVNGELTGLNEAVTELAMRLEKGARICVITFHSLEDRIVKNAFRALNEDCICDKSLPVCVCGKRREVEILTKKPCLPSEAELTENSRSASAKLRVAERI